MPTVRRTSLLASAIALVMTAGAASWAANSQTQGPDADASHPAAAATGPMHGKLRARFEAANTTHDGCLTLDQARAGHLKHVAENFDAIDTTQRHCIHLDEIHQWMRNRAQTAPGDNPAGGGTQ